MAGPGRVDQERSGDPVRGWRPPTSDRADARAPGPRRLRFRTGPHVGRHRVRAPRRTAIAPLWPHHRRLGLCRAALDVPLRAGRAEPYRPGRRRPRPAGLAGPSLPTPGHIPGHLALFREGDRALIPGDAVLTANLNSLGDTLSQRHTLGGPPRFATWNWRAATESVSELARLEPSVLAPGHGIPMAGPVLAPALRALDEQLSNPASAGSSGSSAGRKLTEWVLNFFDYSRRAR